jgi:signal peptidase I
MSPALEDGQYVLLMPPFLHGGRLRRGDVVVFRQLTPPWGWLIKRVVGMPDESIVLDGGRLYADDLLLIPGYIPAGPGGKINGNWWNGPDEYFVLGDNPARSTDSRAFGPVPADRIIGRAWLRIWPPKAWGRVR